MVARLHVVLLRIYQRLPTKGRRVVVRTISPSFTVGSMCFIEGPEGALLLVRQVYRQQWGVPGGLLKRGEDATDAARREVLEEVGVAVELCGEPAVVVEAEPQRVDVVYRARILPSSGFELDEATAVPRPCSPEIVDVGWFASDALPELQHETAAALVALARSSTASPSPPVGGPEPAPSGTDHDSDTVAAPGA